MVSGLNALLKAKRLNLGLTQRQFAKKIGIAYSQYNFIENGKAKNLGISTLNKIAKILDLPVSTVREMIRG